MKYLFSDEGLRVLHQFAQSNPLVALDYDGTLAAIVDDPAQAHMRLSTRTLLARLAQRYRTLVLTGRSRSDALRFLEGIENISVIGNHGSESPESSTHDSRVAIAKWKAHLTVALASLPGVEIEDKAHSLSIHYRRAINVAEAKTSIVEAASGLSDARMTGGKYVFNITPAGAMNKGSALLSEASRRKSARCIFVGDDVTDEDVFRLDRPDEILSIRTELSPYSAAAYFLRGQTDIDVLLRYLVE